MSQFYVGVSAGSLPPTVPTSFVTDNGTVIPSGNIINVNGGAGVQVIANPNGSNNMVVNVVTDGMTWSDKSVTFNAAVENGYFCNAALTVNMPTIGLVNGSTVIIFVDTSGAVVVQTSGGQSIQVGNEIGTSSTSTIQGSTLTLIYRVSDTTWHTISSVGTWSTT